MAKNWLDPYSKFMPPPAAGPYPLPGPGGVMPGPGMGIPTLPPAAFGAMPPSFGGSDPPSYSGGAFIGDKLLDRAPLKAPFSADQGARPAGPSAAIQWAVEAIRNGADPKAVRARLRQFAMDGASFDSADPFSDLAHEGRHGPNGLAGDAALPTWPGRDVSGSKTSLGLATPDGAGPNGAGTPIGGQSRPEARFYPAAYAQDHLDTEQDWTTAYQMAKLRGGDPQDWFQMLRGGTPRAASIPSVPAVHAAPLPNDHPLAYPSHVEGDDIVVTGPRKARREALTQATLHSALLQRLRTIIGTGEGGYESYNSGTVGGRVVNPSMNPPRGTVTGRTINEILTRGRLPHSDPRRMHVVGQYQISQDNLAGAVREMRLTGNELLTPELQDRIFAEYLIPHTPALANFIYYGRGTVDDAQEAAARRWASIAVPPDRLTQTRQVSRGDRTYYDRTPANRASVSATNALRAFLMSLRR